MMRSVRRTPLGRAVRSSLAAVALLGCASAHRADGAPTLARLSPDSVVVAPGGVVEVVIIGSGFRRGASGENTVHFAQGVLRSVPANDDGTRIVFVVPDAIDSGGEAPPIRLISGSYPVQVETISGTSNVLMLRIFR